MVLVGLSCCDVVMNEELGRVGVPATDLMNLGISQVSAEPALNGCAVM